MTGRPGGRALLVAGVVAAVTAVVVAAVAVLDSPGEERRRRLDARRVSDLQAIAGAVDVYWTREGTLPADLDELGGWQGMDAPATDPVTGEAYVYRVTGERSFALCARFETETPGRDQRGSWRRHTRFWHHPAGDHCFDLEAEEVER